MKSDVTLICIAFIQRANVYTTKQPYNDNRYTYVRTCVLYIHTLHTTCVYSRIIPKYRKLFYRVLQLQILRTYVYDAADITFQIK